MAEPQVSENFGNVVAHEVAQRFVQVSAVQGASQPDMDWSVRVAHAVPHPRVEAGIRGGDIEMGAAAGPFHIFFITDLACLAQPAGQVPAGLFASYSRMSAREQRHLY